MRQLTGRDTVMWQLTGGDTVARQLTGGNTVVRQLTGRGYSCEAVEMGKIKLCGS